MRKLAAFRKLSSPFVGDKPLDSISLCFYGDSTGIKEWNRSSDPMPIKTMNNNGLQVLEEVPGEYKILIDKDAVFTTVQKYAPGSYQTFMERKADVDNSRSLLKGYKIEWTQQDDSDLFIQCNNEAISKIENQPMTLDEPTQPVVLEPRTVPTTYECCFRAGSDGIYIGEGYENLVPNKGYVEKTYTAGGRWADVTQSMLKLLPSTIYSVKVNKTNGVSSVFAWTDVFEGTNTDITTSKEYTGTTKQTIGYSALRLNFEDGINYLNAEVQFTKTTTPKPFVKSVMPSGKLDRITNANETTHTFLNKGDRVVTFGNGYFSLKGEKIQQLLVYNALLTEQEKQIELAKDIKLR